EEVSFKENSNKIATKKSFKESINIATKKDMQAKKEAFLEKQNIAKLKRDEFRASREKILNMRQSHSTHQIQSSRVKANNRSNNRNSRDGGTEFEFESVGELYDAFGDVLESNGAGCDGCDGNLEMMEVDDYLDIRNEDEFNEWGMSFGFDSYYFQFIDENQSGEYDEGEIYAVSSEGGNASSVHSISDFVDPDGVNIQLSLSNTGWEGTGGWDNGGIYVGPHVSVQPDGFNTPDGDGYFVRNYTGTSTSKYAITKEADDNTIQGADRGNIVFTADWAANTDLGARFVAIVDGVWYASDQFGMETDDHGNMNQSEVTDWEVDLSVNADTDNWYISLAGPPSGYDWRDGVQWDPNPAVDEGGLPAGDITQFGIAWLHTGNGHYGAVDNFSVTNTSNETNRTVAYNGNVFHLNYEEFWMEAYDFDWYNGNSEDFGNIFGTVRDEFENSIPHANLHIWNSNGEGQNFQFEADENGYFSVDVELGEYHVEAYFEGYMSQWMVVVVNEGDFIEVFFSLVEENTNDGPFVEGIVRDYTDFAPIEGAEVIVEMEELLVTMTDENGYYRIDLDNQGFYRVGSWADGYWDDYTMVDVGEDGSQLDFLLGDNETTALLSIWAGTDNWETVAYAELESPQSPQGLSIGDWNGWNFITVDPSEGFADIYGYSEEYGEAYLHLEEIEAGMSYERAIYFYGDSTGGDIGWLIAYVFDDEGSPIEGAEVAASNYDNFDNSYTDEEGHVILYLPGGFYDVEVWSEGFQSSYSYVEIFANEETVVEFFLEPDSGGGGDDYSFIGEFEGHEYYLSEFEYNWNDANDMLSQYEEAYLVSITSEEENNFLIDVITNMTSEPFFTGGFNDDPDWEWSNGEQWEYENWAEGQPDGGDNEHVLVFNDDGYGPGEWDDWHESASLRFIVEVEDDSTGGGETGTFSGMIWDEEERPLNGLVEFSSPEHPEIFIANADGGEFSIELPAGVWSANAHDGDGGNGEYWSDRYDGILYIEPETEQSHDFILFPRAYYGFLDIRAWVHDENGESHPIPGAYIYIEDSSATMSYELELDIWSQADEAIEPNLYVVYISTEYGEQDVWVYAPAGEQTIVEFYFEMENNEHGLIEGHVYNNDGYPIQDAVIEGWNEETAFSTYTDHNGYFGMEVMSGSYELEAHADGYSTEWDYVEVYPNESSYVEFWLDWENDMTMVSGQVADDEGNPISFALVNASYLYDEWESEGSLTDENGYFELYLEEGDYRISAGAEGYWVDAYDSVYVGNDSLWLDFNLTAIEQFDGGWSGNVNLVGNHEPEMIFLGIMSEDYQVLRLLNEPGFQEVPLVNGTYHLFADADGYQDVFMPNAIQIENNMVSFDIHLFEEGFVNPPHIEFAGDVPNDQGRQMRLVWNPGTPGEWDYFPFYSIWRQVNEVPMPLWDFVEVVPWHGMEAYSAVVPTLGDSTDMGIYYSTFRVTAHTDDPMVFYDSEPVTGYSIDNLHPGAPGGVQAFNQDDGILLVWDQPLDEDFGYHKVYRLDLDSEDPAIEFTTSDTFFVDNVANSYLEYWVTAVDLNGNESDPSNVVTITLAIEDGLTIPMEFALQQNYPNPFNPSTQIQYALPTDATVSITIYDLMGREVRSLVNKQVNAGYHSTLWNATNAMGAPVSAGVYIYTITANEYRDVKKMILLK
ncbi:MAG: T9SS type A sorting domain-containing protein, partial [Candidatus Marinimicrobia bacterium]|nr:T9SS type A sorting domain-containing protein [Candidatus Neomarinimicrobiota bacterium]